MKNKWYELESEVDTEDVTILYSYPIVIINQTQPLKIITVEA